MPDKSSRYIPKKVQRQLRENARDRCCVCGHLIPVDEIILEIEGGTLHQHHIIYFSEGGENAEENLLLVCPSCHTRIHAYPERFPHEKLKDAKRHWTQMKHLVAPTLYYEGDDQSNLEGEVSQVRFHVTTLNLEYRITVPASVQIVALSRFISSWIMHPLVTFASLAPYNFMFGQAQLTRLGLARKSEPMVRLSPLMKVAELNIASDDSLIALVDFEWVALMPLTPSEDDELIARITLAWGATPLDLDLHLIPIDSDPEQRVFFGNHGSLSKFPWARLNTDIRSGYGPEVISIGSKARGHFLVAVHNFSGESKLSSSDAIIRIELGNENEPLIFRCPRAGEGQAWNVCIIDCDRRIVDPIDSIRSGLALRW